MINPFSNYITLVTLRETVFGRNIAVKIYRRKKERKEEKLDPGRPN